MNERDWVKVKFIIYLLCYFFLSSPFLFVFRKDRVTCHAGAYVNPVEHADA